MMVGSPSTVYMLMLLPVAAVAGWMGLGYANFSADTSLARRLNRIGFTLWLGALIAFGVFGDAGLTTLGWVLVSIPLLFFTLAEVATRQVSKLAKLTSRCVWIAITLTPIVLTLVHFINIQPHRESAL